MYLLGTATDYRKAIDKEWDSRWPTNDVLLQICELSDEPGGTWMFFRVGAFGTTGGSTWTRMLLTLDRGLTADFEDVNGEVIIGDHVLGSALADGDLNNDPPIHQHHFHFFYESNPWRQALNVHGDSECYRNQGTYCVMSEYPEGIGLHARPELGIGADMIDVRPEGSPPLPWYGLAGVRLLRPVAFGQRLPRPIRHSYINVDPHIGMDMHHDDRDVFQTYKAHSGRVLWSTGVIPDIDYVVSAYFHVHREMIEDYWVFEGGGGPLGLWEAPWVDAFMQSLGAAPEDVERLGAKEAGRQHLDRLKRHLSARIKERGAKLLCRHSDFVAHRDYDAATESDGEGAMRFEHDFIGGRVVCPLSKYNLTGDVRWTAVVFLWPQNPTVKDPYPMHTLIRVYHTTRSDIRDDDSRWRTPPCNITETWEKNSGAIADHSCGEEFYLPLDTHLLLTAFNFVWCAAQCPLPRVSASSCTPCRFRRFACTRYPRLTLWGLQQIQRVGLPKIVQIFTGGNSGGQSFKLYGSAALVLLLVGLVTMLRCCCRACCGGSAAKPSPPMRSTYESMPLADSAAAEGEQLGEDESSAAVESFYPDPALP